MLGTIGSFECYCLISHSRVADGISAYSAKYRYRRSFYVQT
jgi:hypothetical protein